MRKIFKMELLLFALVGGGLYLYHQSQSFFDGGGGGPPGGINIKIDTGGSPLAQQKQEPPKGSSSGLGGGGMGGGGWGGMGGSGGGPATPGPTGNAETWDQFRQQRVESNPWDAFFSQAGQTTADVVEPGGFNAAVQEVAQGAVEGATESLYEPGGYLGDSDPGNPITYDETPTMTEDGFYE